MDAIDDGHDSDVSDDEGMRRVGQSSWTHRSAVASSSIASSSRVLASQTFVIQDMRAALS